jgi:tetratricopeptide (TPR) repeat protein
MEQAMLSDAQGHALSSATSDSVALYDQAVRAYNLVYGDAVGLFEAARKAAPDFAMAHLGKAWLFTLAFDPGLAVQVRALLDTAKTLSLNEREHAHVAALTQAVAGARGAAVAILDRHLMHYPHDLLAHQAANLLDGFLGRFPWIQRRAARALPFWSAEQPGYATVRAFHGFGLEEAGDYARAEDESRMAAAQEPHSFWAHHTVAHAMEMSGRPEDGLGWMAAREQWWASDDHPNRVHIWWHRSLFHLELGQYDAALALYDGPIRETQRPLGVSLTNASALLWRLDLLGTDVGDRWRELAALWQGHADGACLPFADIHAAMAELRSGQEANVERRLGWMRETAARDAAQASCYREVAVPVVEGLFDFHRGDYRQAVATLQQVRYELWRIGGSHAQRDVIDWTLTEAALRAGMRDVALSLAYERLDARQRSVVNRNFKRRAEQIAA